MAKVTITLEDNENGFTTMTTFDPSTPHTNEEFTSAQRAGLFLTQMLQSTFEVKDGKIGRMENSELVMEDLKVAPVTDPDKRFPAQETKSVN